jgi:hypothetical protein
LGLRQARYRLGSVEEIGGKIIMACVERRLDYWIAGGGWELRLVCHDA